MLAVPRDHPLGGRPSITFARLRDYSLVTLARGSGLRTVLENACRETGFRPRIVAEAVELRSLVELAAQGLGVAVLPRSAVPDAEPRLAVVALSRPRLQRRTALAWNEGMASPAGRAFLTLAKERLPG